ncbi:DUF4192 domain-containing protein [Actinomadura violacea]|uniref:DUF4192 domain-containing protein n=1 Tax=Actinomadura violacea TaxID=2819934 RepID=A0ABS3S7N9_9ACTN|nr:DUF4192 domain-containing protein [Actinomadura violacea]MBO2465005.1 DUF4192 domain-containing protein [Actinomadura violacea]
MSHTESAFGESPGPSMVTTLAEIVTLVPFMLGFTPTDSLVVVGIGDPPGPAMRVGLAPADQPIEVKDAVAAAAGERVASVMTHNQATAVIVVGYGDSEPVTAFGTIVETVLREAGVQVLQGVRVQDDRFWSFTCPDSQCCPPEGTPLNSQTSVVAAEAVLRGFSVADSRDTVPARLAPVTGQEADRVKAAIKEASDHLTDRTQNLNPAARRLYLIDQGEELIDSLYERIRGRAAFETVDHLEIARLLILLQEPYNRDLAMIGIGSDHAAEFLEFWGQVLTRAIPGLVSGPACLTVQAALCAGEGVIAKAAVERGTEDAPDDPMLILLRQMVDVGANPEEGPAVTPEEFSEGYRTEIKQLRRDARHDAAS